MKLNYDNKLFILTGKKHNQFFYYDYEKNEMFQLAETLSSHCGGHLIYNPLNNSIYCLGGLNTKKCEVYKNDEILISNNQQTNENLYNKWETVPDLNCTRYDFGSIVINGFLYAFFGMNNTTKINNNTIERLNVIKNDSWELINFNNTFSVPQTLNGFGILNLNDRELLLMGGSDGKNCISSIYTYNLNNNTIKTFNENLPRIKSFMMYAFNKEPQFTKINCYDVNETKLPTHVNIDCLNRLHLVNVKRFDYQIIDLNK